MDIRVFDNMDDLTQSFTDWLAERLTEKEYLTISLSGGSTPKRLFDHWASLPQGEIDWTKIKFFWGDERCVPPENEESNYKMTKDHLFNFVSVPEKNIFRIQGENEVEAEAERYATVLEQELESKNGTPVFDIMMLGMGDDGHTASIFPHEIALWESNRNCVAATHPESGQKRVSVTGKVINAARHVVFLVTGENKAEKIGEIVRQPNKAEKKYPAALVQPDSGNLTWFMDNKAAKLLKSSV
ncbi:MAG: 6-phosphogluconolactonase [Bacteroidales bacterium]|nr:6-phosphogluconolactonase [Bacteroidales bacterium]